jgi:DUF4097 and DUF4098 domain-containing protein YvlB
MKKALIIVAASLAGLAVLGGAFYAAAQAFDTTRTDHETISRSVKHVVIKADSGDIELVPGGRSVEVETTRQYFLDSPDVSRSIEDGVLTLKSECGNLASISCDTDYRVEVPEGVTVDVRTYVGDVEADGIEARRIEARAYVGDVDIDATRQSDVTARTNVGDIDVELPKGAYDIDSDTAVGDSDVAGLISSDHARHSIDAQSDVGTVNVAAR